VRQRALIIDALVAVIAAILVLVVSPGLAITAIVALLVLVGFGVHGLLSRGRGR